MKDISASSTRLKDLVGNNESLKMSRASLITNANSVDFEPGFDFRVYATVTGDIEVVPSDNDSLNENLSQKEKAYFNSVGSVIFADVPIGTELPVLCKSILAAGTTSTGIVIGK